MVKISACAIGDNVYFILDETKPNQFYMKFSLSIGSTSFLLALTLILDFIYDLFRPMI